MGVKWWHPLVSIFLVGLTGANLTSTCQSTKGDIYGFQYTTIDGTRNVSLSEYKGFTPQYLAINAIYDSKKAKGFSVVGFPCAEFLNQEPGANATEILNGLKHIRPGHGFVPHFPLALKGDVNGVNEHPLYTFLKGTCPPATSAMFLREGSFWANIKISDITWNFEKFLIDRNGKPVMRALPEVTPDSLEGEIDRLLGN